MKNQLISLDEYRRKAQAENEKAEGPHPKQDLYDFIVGFIIHASSLFESEKDWKRLRRQLVAVPIPLKILQAAEDALQEFPRLVDPQGYQNEKADFLSRLTGIMLIEGFKAMLTYAVTTEHHKSLYEKGVIDQVLYTYCEELKNELLTDNTDNEEDEDGK